MPSDVTCDCSVCACGAPRTFKLTISGIVPCGYSPCPECPGLDGTYILDFDPQLSTGQECIWKYVEPVYVCAKARVWYLHIRRHSDCTLTMEAAFYVKPNRWSKTGIAHCWEPQYELTGGAECFPDRPLELSCQFPDTITIEPIGVYSLEDTECIVGESCQKSPKTALPDPGPPGCRLDLDCGCAACAAAAAKAQIAALGKAAASCGCAEQCAPAVNLNNGNLSVRLDTPDAGTVAPGDVLTYNSRLGGASPFGYGVSSAYGASVQAKGECDAFLFRCDGSKYCFASKNPADGVYRYIPPGAPSHLQRTADGWLETERPPKGNKYYYDTSGQLARIEAPGGRVWTVTHGSSLSSILDPAGRLTTYGYDASGKIQRIMDVHGRVTTFAVDANGNLTQRITPELCITELVYGSNPEDLHQLQAVVAPDGARTSFSYDTNGWCRGIGLPDGRRTTYSYEDWDTTEVTDPAGNVTTLIHDGTPSRNIAAVIDPLGNCTTQTWQDGFTTSIQDAEGRTTTYTYAAMSTGLKQVESVQTASGRFTYVFDSNDWVEATVDALGRRTTYVRDAEGRPTGIMNPLGELTTYVYNGNACPIATIDPLGNRHPLSFDGSGEVQAKSGSDGMAHAMREGPWKLVFNIEHDKPAALYNLSDDLAEQHNLIADSVQTERIQRMEKLYREIRASKRSVPVVRGD